MSLLRLADISRVFGKVVALQDVALEMTEGSIHAVIGPNGAGKTTLFNLISGFFPPTTGDIWFDGASINHLDAPARVAAGLVRTFQITEIFPELSVYENVRIGVEAEARLSARAWPLGGFGRGVRARVEELLETTGLTRAADRTVSELAHGDQRVVEVAMVLSRKPRLMLLDEPTAGMGQAETEQMVKLIGDLHAEHKQSILFIEHDMDLVFGLADRITVLNYGRVLASGTPDEVAANAEVQAAYLGDPA